MAKKSILFDEILSNKTIVSKILHKKRAGILKSSLIFNEDNEKIEDLFSEQMILLALSKNETLTRSKTLKVFQKKVFYEDYDHQKKKLPSILTKQASLKEILISSKKLKMDLDQKKASKQNSNITEFWSDQYYRSLLKHTKLDHLIKETEKGKIWKNVKSKSLFEDSNFKNISPIKSHNNNYSSSRNNNSPTNFPPLLELNKNITLRKRDKVPSKRLKTKRNYNKSEDKKHFYLEANNSIQNIINACSQNDDEQTKK